LTTHSVGRATLTQTDMRSKYGAAQNRPEYELLREVTHWRVQDVERERQVRMIDVTPSYVLEHSFSELLDHFEFGTGNGL
jgi:hypothetical protein